MRSSTGTRFSPVTARWPTCSRLATSRRTCVSYGTAIRETQLGFPLLGLVALVVAPARARALIWLGVLVSAAIASVYLLYRPFPEWWYLRFLLPALCR